MNWGRQSRGSIRSSFICGNRKSGAPSCPAARRAGAAAVDLPVPQAEDQEVGQPDEHARDDQLAAVGDVVVQQEVRERDRARRRWRRSRTPSARARPAGAPGARARAGGAWPGTGRPAARPRAPGSATMGPTVSRCGQPQLQADRREHRQPGPARTTRRPPAAGRDGRAELWMPGPRTESVGGRSEGIGGRRGAAAAG